MSATSRSRSRGVSVIAAIFLLVVVGVLGAYIASVATTQHSSEALDLQGTRAYQAAYAGIQWGAFQALRSASCASSTSFALSGGLSGFAVTVACTQTAYTENGASRHLYRVTATGCNMPIGNACPGTQAGGYYVERQIEATLDR
ncbi:MAG TPA: agglutinin biogenesis protein MshP [Burkholderiales bacterium]|nr:agglutinin biogenesis protein MshP [Burkholderiales bacterium]